MFNVIQKKIRQNNTIIFRFKNNFIKCPFCFGSLREMIIEKNKINFVRKDIHFSRHLLDYRYIFLYCSITPEMSPLDVSHDSFLIKLYFENAFLRKDEWQLRKVADLIEWKFLANFIKQHELDNDNLIRKFVENIKMPQSSSHGDFYQDNILVKNNQLFFIDWSRYCKVSSRYFDLIDYYLYSKKYTPNEGWMDVWNREFKIARESIFGIPMTYNIYLSYGLWKTAMEISVLYRFKRLNKNKCKKYLNYIKKFYANKLYYTDL